MITSGKGLARFAGCRSSSTIKPQHATLSAGLRVSFAGTAYAACSMRSSKSVSTRGRLGPHLAPLFLLMTGSATVRTPRRACACSHS